jgi:hypothetical protein
MHRVSFIFLSVCLLIAACRTTGDTPASSLSPTFSAYWMQGEAEITSYTLSQARYGELREGHAVMVFVTEPFSRSKGVKLNDPEAAGTDRVEVLKLNMTRDFNTGIYPYTVMTSVFSPISEEVRSSPLKVTSSMQEWCGQVFTQITQIQEDRYRWVTHSYFEGEEADQLLSSTWLEDEIWSQIRMNPAYLPLGEFDMIPAAHYLRFAHIAPKAVKANAGLQHEDSLSTYTITFPELQRSVAITYRSEFPYAIESWKETYPDGFGTGGQLLVTNGIKRKRMMLDYWNYNQNQHHPLRDSLGLN